MSREDVGGTRDRVKEYEHLIGQIRDVISTRVITDPQCNIEEIHVLAGSGRSPKQIVRDVESAFMTQFGLAVDHKKISIAQVQDQGQAEVSLEQARVKLGAVSFSTTGPRADCHVQLELSGDVYEGGASGANSATGRLRLVATATVAAVEQYFKSTPMFSVDDIVSFSVAGRRVVNVVLTMMTSIGEESFVGSSLVKDDEREAVARATLDAINRKLAMLVRK
ncbi:MAG: hypothetical protein ACYC6V_02405 [Bacillota bacterium]